MLFNVTDGESAGEQHLGDVPNHFDLQNWIDAVSVISLAILHAWVGTSPRSRATFIPDMCEEGEVHQGVATSSIGVRTSNVCT